MASFDIFRSVRFSKRVRAEDGVNFFTGRPLIDLTVSTFALDPSDWITLHSSGNSAFGIDLTDIEDRFIVLLDAGFVRLRRWSSIVISYDAIRYCILYKHGT